MAQITRTVSLPVPGVMLMALIQGALQRSAVVVGNISNLTIDIETVSGQNVNNVTIDTLTLHYTEDVDV